MPTRLKNYGRNYKKRKEYIHQWGLLLDEFVWHCYQSCLDS
jgi:hypothetical protein